MLPAAVRDLARLLLDQIAGLTARQKDLMREFEKLSEDNNPEGSSFFSKVRTF